METSVEGLWKAMSRCHFLPLEQIRILRDEWLQDAGSSAGQLDRFAAWMISRGVATEYQIGVLCRGNGHQLFLGGYQILERIGKGRLAGVYKARHTSGAIVAIKILPPSKAAQEVFLVRFQRELTLAVSLQHANVIRSLCGGEERGLHYLVMEHLEGETLEEVLRRRKRLTVSEAVDVVRQALLGLQAIHEKGLVHRDLEPSNLMLVGAPPHTTLGSTVKILDMGMGRSLFDEGEPTEGSNLTQPGDLLGAAPYRSPEQARDPHNVDTRSDIYALGCILYHALAGEPPFADSNSVRQLLRHATEEPRPITQLNREVPAALDPVLGWMLAKDPAQRYPTPARAAQALQGFLTGNSKAPRTADTGKHDYRDWIHSLEDSSGPPAVDPVLPSPGPPRKRPKPSGEHAPSRVIREETGTGKTRSENVPTYPGWDVEIVQGGESARPAIRSPEPPPAPPAPPVARGGAKPREDHGEAAARKYPVAEPERGQPTPAFPQADAETNGRGEPERILGMTVREFTTLFILFVSVVGLAALGLPIVLIWRWVS